MRPPGKGHALLLPKAARRATNQAKSLLASPRLLRGCQALSLLLLVYAHLYGGGAPTHKSLPQPATSKFSGAAPRKTLEAAGSVQPRPRSIPSETLSRGRQQRCAIVNTVTHHFDVAAGVAYAFQEAGCNVTCYLHYVSLKSNMAIQDVMGGWFQGSFADPSQLADDVEEIDNFIFVTLHSDDFPLLNQLLVRQAQATSHRRGHSEQQRFLLVVHNPADLLYRPWLASVMFMVATEEVPTSRLAAATRPPPAMELLALSPAVANYTKAYLEAWAAGLGSRRTAQVSWLSPVMPWRPTFGTTFVEESKRGIFTGPNQFKHLCIQGSITSLRRDYRAAFLAMLHPLVMASLLVRKELVMLLGSSSSPGISIFRQLHPHVRIKSGKSYQSYYDQLSRCRAILPAFARDDYLVNKSSSSIASALTVGTPLVADERTLRAYGFEDASMVYAFQPKPERPSPNATLEGMLAGAAVARDPVKVAEWHQVIGDPLAAAAAAAQAAIQHQQRQQAEEAAVAAVEAEQERQKQAKVAVAGTAVAADLLARGGGGSSGGGGSGGGEGVPSPGGWLQDEGDMADEEEDPTDEEMDLERNDWYSQALLRLFEPGVVELSHGAAREMKKRVMARSVSVARQFLVNTVKRRRNGGTSDA